MTTETNENSGTITVSKHPSDMIIIKNSFTGKTFALYPDEAVELYKTLKDILYPVDPSTLPTETL